MTRHFLRSAWRGLLASAIAGTIVGAQEPSISRSPAEVRAASPSPIQPATPTDFRLGTAARPLGWSTLIGDFNKDGTPDLAIADRTGHQGGGYQFSLEFSVSGLRTQTVAIESAQEAVTLRASDVDDDDDLDVVVTGVLSHAVVGVWLNDGYGRFGKSDVTAVPAAVVAIAQVDTERRQPIPTAATISSSELAGLRPSVLKAPRQSPGHIITSVNRSATATGSWSSGGSRAPPTAPILSIA